MNTEEEDINIVYIGQKPTKNYVLAVTTQATRHDEVKIMARGNLINKAIDISQICILKQLQGWDISSINIGSTMQESNKEINKGEKQRVSFIELTLTKA